MGAVLSLEIEREKRQRSGYRAAQECGCVDQLSHSSGRAFERATYDTEFASLCRELSGNPGTHATDFLRQLNQVERGNAPLIVRAGMAATIAGNFRNHASKLLHRGLSVLSSFNSLAGGTDTCRTERAAETFGPERSKS